MAREKGRKPRSSFSSSRLLVASNKSLHSVQGYERRARKPAHKEYRGRARRESHFARAVTKCVTSRFAIQRSEPRIRQPRAQHTRSDSEGVLLPETDMRTQ